MPFSCAYNPERPARPGPLSRLVEDNGQVPRLSAAGGAGGVGHQELSILHTPEDNEVAGGGKVALAHDGNHQPALAERVQNALGLVGPAPLHSQAPSFGRVGDQGVVRALALAPAAVFIGTL